MGLAAKIFKFEEPKGYYERQKTHFQLPTEVQRIEINNGECQRITKLNARSFTGWIACGVGVISCSAAVFSLIAVWKGNEKFKQEIMLPIKEFVSKK